MAYRLYNGRLNLYCDGERSPGWNERGKIWYERSEVECYVAYMARVYRRDLPGEDVVGNWQIQYFAADEPQKKPIVKRKVEPKKMIQESARPIDTIIAYTDGASVPTNPGYIGAGAVIYFGGQPVELSEHLGYGTNNQAELIAIELVFDFLIRVEDFRPLLIYSDSTYCIGVLSKKWRPKKNQELIARIKSKISLYKDRAAVRFEYVRGHSGIEGNEIADRLANRAAAESICLTGAVGGMSGGKVAWLR